ncbi:MAG TPA: AmmeMemoRadiSam system protein B [Candidatus Hydrogenedens sp.]|nr:AmmeMemoRadiSam system protein B [Candidatus Hydrogenedens sp.]HOK09270.1 AmmeMemoRadiSam system protein B [Candidatus Hydrogenedens sp.]HOL19856.1 AmmeMemoRadiSam system protein B [Candidatus Hydrogenedens sp.]HPP59444.1 AmmeMemoRadiSam system protein B [Candidatus Hydrogenedens sp.]
MSKRAPAVSGQFYPKDPKLLLAQASLYIEQAKTKPSTDKVLAIIAPHAGYMYSGPTAGFAFARIREQKINRVLIIGRSHRYLFDGLAICDYECFTTPLGEFPVDISFYEEMKEKLPCIINYSHLYEHCLEVMLPFLFVSNGIVPIVPILLGNECSKEYYEYGEILASLTDKKDLLIASTDLSHYLPEPQANEIDNNTIQSIASKDPNKVINGIKDGLCSMCGSSAVVLAMGFASTFGNYSVNVLDYSTSGKTSGDYSSVVGYTAISFELSQQNN